MCQKWLAIISALVLCIDADVSHLFKNAYSTYQAALNTINGGYYYDPPLVTTTTRPFAPTTQLVPEIIVNKKKTEVAYGTPNSVYLPPAPEQPAIIVPPQADDFDPFYPAELPPSPAYLPPSADPLPDPPTHVYLPPPTPTPLLPPQDEVIDHGDNDGYHYPVPSSRGLLKDIDLFRPAKNAPLQLELNDLRCMDGRTGHFRANIVVQSFIENLPIIDTDLQDPRCRISLVRTKFVLNLMASDFQRCGVHSCGDKELCLKLRFPQIGGMKSIGDAMLTLQCKVQEKTVSKTHSLRFGVNNYNQARSAGTYAHGGNQQPFRTQLGLFRYVDGSFTKSLEPGSVVHLGEELMLRAHVKSGDGWNHSRVSDVSLQRLSPAGEILNSATLIKSDGCVNPTMRSICPFAPVFEPPLGYRIAFRAVMFQGMKSGDEMIMSVRIVGCMDQHDCAVEHHHCSDNAIGRIRREVFESKEDLVEVSRISFRVQMPPDPDEKWTASLGSFNPMGGVVAAVTICCVCILGIICFSIANRRFLQRQFGQFADDLIN